ncbi:MAG: thiol peroxidase [Coriobacteriaceae bacterium]|nr:thiol peroxidase [Coriobacteriaceae bacterium]
MRTVTFNGEQVTLRDEQLKVGDKLPLVDLFDNNMTVFKTEGTSGVRAFLVVPSLDTPVCDAEVRAFNEKAAELPDVSIFAVSVDLPFAQARWCGAAKVEAVKTISDYNGAEFGRATGTYISEFALLARAIFIVDASDTVVYVEILDEVNSHPDYQAAYDKLNELIA